MYDEVMQLIALAKNDEEYFKRIDALKQQMLELAQVKEIAKTLAEADMHLAGARQKADEVLEKAQVEADQIKDKARLYLEEQKNLTDSMKALKAELKLEKDTLKKSIADMKLVEVKSEQAIKEHRELTALRNDELAETTKLRQHLESKFQQIKQLINS